MCLKWKGIWGKIKWGRMMRVNAEAERGIVVAVFHGIVGENPSWKMMFGQSLKGLREPCRYLGEECSR